MPYMSPTISMQVFSVKHKPVETWLLLTSEDEPRTQHGNFNSPLLVQTGGELMFTLRRLPVYRTPGPAMVHQSQSSLSKQLAFSY